jgi:N-dimethylarginine dimethylaminohydrolase
MKFKVDYLYDRLRVCAVGRAYPPEFYSFIHDPTIRSVMERIAEETEEDYQKLISLLKIFNVEVVRTVLPTDFLNSQLSKQYFPAAMTPRDHCGMIGNQFFISRTISKWNTLRGPDWPILPPKTDQEFNLLPDWVKQELNDFNVTDAFGCYDFDHSGMRPIEDLVSKQGNEIIYDKKIDTATILRLGQDLVVGTEPGQNFTDQQEKMEKLFPNHNIHIIDSQGHLDGCVCVLCPGLIVSRNDIELCKYFDDWKVIIADNEDSKPTQNKSFTRYVENYFHNWLGDIEETIIDINMLSIDKHNVISTNTSASPANKLIEKEGINVHTVNFRHYQFWDGGIHCITNDLHRTNGL